MAAALSGVKARSSACASRVDDEVGVKLHALKPANAKGRETIIVLQPSELALDGGATTEGLAKRLAKREPKRPRGLWRYAGEPPAEEFALPEGAVLVYPAALELAAEADDADR